MEELWDLPTELILASNHCMCTWTDTTSKTKGTWQLWVWLPSRLSPWSHFLLKELCILTSLRYYVPSTALFLSQIFYLHFLSLQSPHDHSDHYFICILPIWQASSTGFSIKPMWFHLNNLHISWGAMPVSWLFVCFLIYIYAYMCMYMQIDRFVCFFQYMYVCMYR